MSDDRQAASEAAEVQIRSSVWPCDASFLEALHASWAGQYADYIGESSAVALVNSLLESGELYPDKEQVIQLATIDSEPVGIAASRALKGLSLITMLEVLEAYRHRGVGRRLLAGLQARTQQRLLAHVSIHRPGVLRFYESQGFCKLPRTRVDHYGHELEFDVVVK